jgi:hypothetical protein
MKPGAGVVRWLALPCSHTPGTLRDELCNNVAKTMRNNYFEMKQMIEKCPERLS